MTGRAEGELQEALLRLAEAGLVFARGSPPHASYLFKHALVRDAAYGSLLRRRREELHAHIAAVLETDFPEAVAAQPELLARHLTEAGLFEKAVPWWLRAGERATERSANSEAVAQLERGLEILMRLPESQARDEQELLLQAALIGPRSANEGFASAALRQAATRAAELGRRIAADLPAQTRAVEARIRLANVHLHDGKLRTGLVLAQEALALAERFGDPFLLSHADFVMGQAHIGLGDPAAARRHYEEGLALYDPERDRAQAARLSFDVCSRCRSMVGFVLWLQGFPDEALRHEEEAIAATRAAAHPTSETSALIFAAEVHQWRGELALCRDRAEAALALAAEHGFPHWAAIATALGGWALVKEARAEEGLARLRAGVEAHRATGVKLTRPQWLALFAEACLVAGRIEDGLSAVRGALAAVEETEARIYQAELHRLEGELVLASDKPDESRAEASFRKAIAIARKQGAKSWELRAATSLARLLARQSLGGEACALLAPVYDWFTEGFDTADLVEAKALLDELT